MLKIKDDYDLNNLKKYGFEHIVGNDEVGFGSWDFWELELEHTTYEIPKERNIIIYSEDNYYHIELDTLYDMIQDGIVERIDWYGRNCM